MTLNKLDERLENQIPDKLRQFREYYFLECKKQDEENEEDEELNSPPFERHNGHKVDH